MEDPLPQEKLSDVVTEDNIKELESAENFQKFIYDLFDKNGVLNDLRAYLHGHIVEVLRSARTGDPPACQKHFTQRLDLTYQALNMLIAEYLLTLEFSYSFSVFISEIPLSNMVFQFAKTLMQCENSNISGLKFLDVDVWSILNYLGVKCDSEHASNIVEMYKTEQHSPLLLCILKGVPMYDKETIFIEQANSSNDSISSDPKSSVSFEKSSKCAHKTAASHEKCKHFVFCKACQNKLTRVKEKYRRKKRNITKMFEQLKTVYEAEIEMVKKEQDKKVKRCLANQALQLQQRRDELEESFKAREAELERNVEQKKKFLWGLARALRVQHDHMTKAMHDVRLETDRLTDKEENLKTQLAEAENALRKRGEEMRTQISNELVILQAHLDSMKNERDSINKERSELEHLKVLCDTKEVVKEKESELLNPHYELKNELSILKKYIESTKSETKSAIERSTITDLKGVTSRLSLILNNGQDLDSVKSEERGRNVVVNDLKKSKNVNFSQSNLDEIYRERSRERSRSSASSEAGDSTQDRGSSHQRDIILQLRQENERLKDFATQQRQHIDELSSQQARLQAELVAERFRMATEAIQPPSRPRTAPAQMPRQEFYIQGVNMTASANTMNYGWRKGAGEELNLFSNAQPRIYLPGDNVPFIGVLRDRHTDNRRHLINQWRILRRHVSPVGVLNRARTFSPGRRTVRPASAGPSIEIERSSQQQKEARNAQTPQNIFEQPNILEIPHHRPKPSVTLNINKNREKSPKSVLKEAKDNLRNKTTIQSHNQPTPREKSPNSVLREAKLRLRKLEIEAEAVEKSYMDFRKQRSQLKNEKQIQETVLEFKSGALDPQKVLPSQKIYEPYKTSETHKVKDFEKSMKTDLDKYLLEYQCKVNYGDTHFRNRNLSTQQTKPIPESYSKIEGKDKVNDYIGTPLNEFRKFYDSGRFRSFRNNGNEESIQIRTKSPDDTAPAKDRPNKEIKEDKNIELEWSENTNKSYNVTNGTKKIGDNDDNLKNIGMITTKSPDKTSPRNDSSNKEVQEDKNIESELNKNLNILYNETEKYSFNDSNLNNEMEENLLTVEVESLCAVSDIKVTDSQTQNLLLVVESVGDAEFKSKSEEISTKMTIIVSPKRSPKKVNVIETEITRNLDDGVSVMKSDELDAIFRTEENFNISSVKIQSELSKDVLEDSISDGEKYPDDFSADVDNYNVRSEYDISPISLPKTSEDEENFWDS